MRAALRLILLMQTLEAFAYYTLGNVLTLHLTSIYGVSDTAAGVHFGIRSALTTVYATLFGPVIDWFGPFRMLPIAFALAAIGRAIFAQVDSLSLALAAIYLPMAAGHGLTNAAFIICIKRITSSSTSPNRPPDAPWGFALQYCALVLGIAICGPTIDIVTARWAPAPPYRALAFLSAVCSVLGLGASLVLLPIAPPSPKMMHSRGGAATAAEAVQVALEAFAELRRTACTALHDAVDARRIVQFLRVFEQLVPGFGNLQFVFLVEVGAIQQQRNIAVDRHRHELAARVVRFGGCVPIDRIVVADHLRIEAEGRIDVVDRCQEAAMVHFLVVEAVHDQQIELAVARPHRSTLFFEAAAERIDVEIDLVA
jgi:MFS family permease